MTKRDSSERLQDAGVLVEQLTDTPQEVLSALSAEEAALFSRIYKHAAESARAVVHYTRGMGCFVSAII